MSTSTLSVSLTKLKREAFQLKKEKKIPHQTALDIVAQSYGFSNYHKFLVERHSDD